ncbi:pentapeptide repeat-containing protein [Pilimelia columellifera]|uniref:Pentapeptide repeat-containing protein n=1 Tax=Pilimelia columellifera subsp. columellifera TaxID=706583 RepID=A0ABP6AS37_9ACTN
MKHRQIRDLTILLPGLDDDDLDPVEGAPEDEIFEELHDGDDWSHTTMAGGRVTGSRLVGVDLSDSEWRATALDRTELVRCDLSSARWDRVTVDRATFTGCRMTGIRLREVTLKNVVFDGCRLDYAVLDHVQAAGPVAFTDCVLVDAALTACRLPNVVLDECTLTRLALDDTDVRGTDLRGSRVAELSGLISLRGVRLDPEQLPDLAEIAVRDLEILLGP